ncbi:MAG: hypothetical protein K2W95_10380 [Candidatus Obscuribacterales bacterium]|nr:hypothetical protein [Candidatus Obscuribacterales bacterium]
MIFSSLEYLLFLPLVVLLYWQLKGSWRPGLVVASSLFFYMSWLPIYGILLLLLTTCTWLLGLGVAGAKTGSVKARTLLTFGITLNLGCLCYYKYAGFILANIASSLHMLNSVIGPAIPAWDAPVIEALLPLGISFFVFEFVHYLVDVYKSGQPVKSWMEFTAFASYFPSQIAGPIKRYQDFLARLRSPEKLTPDLFNEAMTLIIQGLFKKIAIADPLGIAIFPVFASNTVVSAADGWLAATGFVIQVYCDFSGYTDIGRGSSLLMGIRLPENFRLPYLSADLTEFWRRWHMSLSEWLRDYVFIPLGGSRDGKFATWKNLMLTMLACGLWHGASWHYIIFGFLQGFGLVVHREWHALTRKKADGKAPGTLQHAAAYCGGVFLTTLFMILTLVFFRSSDLPHAALIFKSLINFQGQCELAVPLAKSGALVFLGSYFVFWLLRDYHETLFSVSRHVPENVRHYMRPALRLGAWSAAGILMIAATPNESVPFVYFQF